MEGRTGLGSTEGDEGRERNGTSTPLQGQEGDLGTNLRHNCLAPVFLTDSSTKKKSGLLLKASQMAVDYLPEGLKDLAQRHYFSIGNRLSGSSRTWQKEYTVFLSDG